MSIKINALRNLSKLIGVVLHFFLFSGLSIYFFYFREGYASLMAMPPIFSLFLIYAEYNAGYILSNWIIGFLAVLCSGAFLGPFIIRDSFYGLKIQEIGLACFFFELILFYIFFCVNEYRNRVRC